MSLDSSGSPYTDAGNPDINEAAFEILRRTLDRFKVSVEGDDELPGVMTHIKGNDMVAKATS